MSAPNSTLADLPLLPLPCPDSNPYPPADPQFYAHFKQANEGDVKGERPGAFNFTAKYKYDAWKKLEGMSKEDAQKKYVELLEAVSTGGFERECERERVAGRERAGP
jgi:diazepam-binding inhibitor (GABA receptor modulating acyl-CoA-binding protein)